MKWRIFASLCLATTIVTSQVAFGQSHGQLLGHVSISGGSTDLSPGTGINANRLGGFGSSLHYDRTNDVYYGLVDRGAGGGAYSFETRIQQFHIDVDRSTGAIGNFVLQQTIPLRNADGSAAFNGVTPGRLNGRRSHFLMMPSLANRRWGW